MHDLWALRGVGVKPEAFPEDPRLRHRRLGSGGQRSDGHRLVRRSGRRRRRRDVRSEAFAGLGGSAGIVRRVHGRAGAQRDPEAQRGSAFSEAACLNVGWSTTYRMLFTRGRAQPGERVLIQGAGGGVATAAISMARAAGLHVTVTSRSEAKRAPRARARRARGDPTGERLREPVDLVVETVGAATWKHSLRSVRPGGRIVTCGRDHRLRHPARAAAHFLSPGVDHRLDVGIARRDAAHAALHGGRQSAARDRLGLSASSASATRSCACSSPICSATSWSTSRDGLSRTNRADPRRSARARARRVHARRSP